MSRPRIGIIREGPGDPAAPDNYANRFLERNCEVVDLYPGATQGLADIDALVLSGGIDVDPALYGESPHPQNDASKRDYDDYEIELLRGAIERATPTLAICRGHQVLNVALGGTLQQHIEGDGHRAFLQDGVSVSRWHDVYLEPGSLLREVYGVDRFVANSRHHQAVTPDRLAPGLRPTAYSPDGFIEAVELADAKGWLVSVQWHPERPEPERSHHTPTNAPLFEAFLAAIPLHAGR